MDDRRVLLRVALGLLVGGCGRGARPDAAQVIEALTGKRLATVDEAARRGLLERARIFDRLTPDEIAARDLERGPGSPDAFAPFSTVSCDFVEPADGGVTAHGTTPKFFCARGATDRPTDLLKVKYGRDNRERVGEVLGARLFWALGLATDESWPVRVRCRGCPADPWAALKAYPRLDPSPRAERDFDDAIVQRLYPAAIVETPRRLDEGWSFDELPLVDERQGGAPRVEVEALVLLAAFIAHGDDKPQNQRLVCPFDAIDARGGCARPRLLIADFGATFGRGAAPLSTAIDDKSRPSLREWSALPVWRDEAACRVYWSTRRTPPHPRVSEAARRFAVERLSALTEAQLRGLFTVARVESLGETVRADDGSMRPAGVGDWVAAFRARLRRLADHSCAN